MHLLQLVTIIASAVLPPRMVDVPAGRFYMGAEGITADYNCDEAPIHSVTITNGFKMSAFEVTNSEYEAFDPSHRAVRGKYGFSEGDDDAVVFVSWNDAMNYCRWLSDKEGKTYRLPTEAEWEYACKAGTFSAYHWGGVFRDDMSKNNVPGAEEKMIFEPLSLKSLRKRPNAWGIYDMHGNVEEWCLDWYGPYLAEPQTDPVGPDCGDFKVTRGGSHTTSPTYLRSSNRSAMPAQDRSFAVGFRIVEAAYPATAPYPETKPVMRKVSQRKAAWKMVDKPVFEAPLRYVKNAPEGVRMFKHNHEPAICWCPNGDLLAIWFSTESEFNREMVILGSRLTKGSSEWSAPFEFFKIPDRNMTGLSLYYDAKSDAIIHLSAYDALGWWRNEAVVMRKSYDNGQTWTRPEIVMPEHCPGHQLIAGMSRMEDGRLMQLCDAGPGNDSGSVLHISSDNGQTWEQCPSAIAGIHAGAVEFRDGSILAFGRGNPVEDYSGTQRMPCSRSRDGGISWSVSASPFPPIRGGQRLLLTRLAEGPILLVSFDNSGKPSRGMFASLSYDDGKSWTKNILLTDGIERCLDGGAWTGTFVMDDEHAEPKGYLAATQTPDGIIHLISSKNHYRFNLKWLEMKLREHPDKPVPIIFDTDMGNDIDDALALAMLYRYSDQGKVDILGITSCKTDPSSVRYIDILNNWYGHSDIPIGQLTGVQQYPRPRTYAEKMVERGVWAGSVQNYEALPESSDLMLDLLRQAEDNSVVIVAVGFFTNLARVLAAEPETVRSKVKSLVLMAGDFRNEDFINEHNVVYDIKSAQAVCDAWPGPVITSPFVVGMDVLYPVDSILDNMGFDTPNPIAEAYKNYKRMPYDRPTWDLSSVLFAVEPESGWFLMSSPGRIKVTDEGRTVFVEDKQGLHRFLDVNSEKSGEVKAQYLNLTRRQN